MENKRKNIVVSGGTTGMGRGIALHYLREGASVTVVGNTPARGRNFLEAAAQLGAQDRASFIQANLMIAEENRRVVREIKARYDRLDALVLTAMQVFPKRTETAEGYEGVFSLYYMSRFILSYGLTDLLEKSGRPVIVSVGGTGMTKGEIHWNDLMLRQKYSMIKATLQGGRANDLLGAAYAQNHKEGKTRFILVHPGYTNSGTLRLKQPARMLMQLMGKLFAQPVEKSIQPIIRLMDNPPPQTLVAWDRTKPVSLKLETLNKENAVRLYEMTKSLIRDES
ncbi:MAG: short-chain dehydrogenase/reductase [Paenibacillaceae bacterium]|jgi:NAD(P)-dependent dehydrogenase (short-subunit alcohol dehydrogenase family)|nr:short-chain dehydrogenase/reductase [Paenibacillaceae bacterium]